MTVCIAVKTGQGLVLGSDSRMTVRKGLGTPDDFAFLDHTEKVWTIPAPYANMVVTFFGNASASKNLVQDLCGRWADQQTERLDVRHAVPSLHEYLLGAKVDGSRMMVGGRDQFGVHLWEIGLPGGPVQVAGPGVPGIFMGGDADVPRAMVQQMDIPTGIMGLSNAVALTKFLVRSAIEAQGFRVCFPSLGGAVRCAVVSAKNIWMEGG